MSPAKSAPVKIVVDVHERQSGIADTLRELGAEIAIAALPAGDYAVGLDTLVERKRVLDLHAAVLKGRFWPQLGKLRAACAFPYLARTRRSGSPCQASVPSARVPLKRHLLFGERPPLTRADVVSVDADQGQHRVNIHARTRPMSRKPIGLRNAESRRDANGSEPSGIQF